MQVATLFRESATLLGAANMMESATATSAAPVSASSSTSPGSSSSTSISPPLQAQSPPQLLQQQSAIDDASIITAVDDETRIVESKIVSESETKITTNTETIVSASLSISSLPPSTTTSVISMENISSSPVKEDARSHSPRSPLTPPLPPLSVPHQDTQSEHQDELSQSPSESDIIGDDDEREKNPPENSPCLPVQLDEDIDMVEVNEPLNNSNPSLATEPPVESSINQMDGCDSNNDTGSTAPKSTDCKEDNQVVEQPQHHMMHEESQEHISNIESLHNCLSSENNRQLLSVETPLGLTTPLNQSIPAAQVPINIINGQLEHQQQNIHHQIHHHHDYSESHHLQQEQERHQRQLLHHDQEQSQLHLQQRTQEHHHQLQRHDQDQQQHHHLLQHDRDHHHQLQHDPEHQHSHQIQHNQEQHHHQLQHDQNHLSHEQEQQQQHQHNMPVPHHEQHPQQQHHIQQQHDQEQHHIQQHHYHHHQFHQQSQPQMHMQQQHHHQQQQHHHPSHPMTCIDDLMIEDNHEDPSNRYKLLSPNVKHESQDDGYETSAGDVLTPSSHASSHSMTPQHQMHTNVILPKCEIPPPPQSAVDDPYNFIDDELNSSIQMMSPSGGPLSMRQQGYPHHPTGPPPSLGTGNSNMMTAGGQLIPIGGQMIGPAGSGIQSQGLADINGPKKRGRKKKIREESGTMVNGILKPVVHKERKKHDRFNGMPEEEVSKRTLPDHLATNLDIIIIGINPGLFAAYKGHHYAGPGNHFWKCLYLSGLTREQMTAEEDYKLLEFGIGFTNMVERATKGSADLTRKEIKEGCRTLLDKLRKFRPKIAVFNGKLIFEVFSGKKDFNFGRQPECIEGTNTYMWVMPSSSARCAQLPRAADKVPFYAALKKFRDYLNGLIPHIEDSECVFSDPKYKQCCEPEPKTENLSYSEITDLSNCNLTNAPTTGTSGQQTLQNCGNVGENGELLQPGKKKRGRPKKIKGLDGCDDGKINARRLTPTDSCSNNNNGLNLSTISNCNSSEMPKKKRGRPKKIKTGDILGSSNNNGSGLGIIAGTLLNGNSSVSSNNGMTNGLEAINNSDLNHNSPNGGMGGLCGGLTQQQQQRLFSPPMHSPSTVGSYCPLGMNASTPPINSSSGSNSNGYHHHPHHQMGTPQHHHNTHQQQHHSSYHQQTSQQQQQQQPPPQQYTPHSDLSSEISAAISSEHLGESPTPTSPSLGPPDFDPPGSMQTDDTNPNDMRFSSPASTISEQQQAGSHLGGHMAGYPPYRNPGSNNSYMSGSGGSSNDGHGSDSYMQQPSSNQSQQQPQQQTTNSNGQPLQMSDVASKSLSGLESLVDQIPTMSDSDGTSTPNHMSTTNQDTRLCDPNDQYGNNCLYTGYPNNMQLNSSSPSATPNSSMLSPHYTNPNFSSNPNPTNCTTSNTSTYGSLSSNFSVSSLTSNNYPTSSYHTNLMATSPHHLGSGSGSSPMYMEPHMPVPVNPLYHPYTQHSGYSGYSPVGPPPTIHMPSPNYPYGYGNTGNYPQPGHHPSHPAAGYLSSHPSMFDRIKPDIGYGGF